MDQLSPITATRKEPVYTPSGIRLWTAEERRDIKQFYKEGRKPSWIQKRYNATPGQIAGLIRRERDKEAFPMQRELKPKPEPKVLEPKPSPLPFKRILMHRKPPKRVRLMLIDSANAVTLMGLEPHMCKWPLGDPRQSDFRYCGCNRAENGSMPYCPGHLRMAIQPSVKKR